jgi:hypothetical protein
MKCDCCRDAYTGQPNWVVANWTVPGAVLEYRYCSEQCKENHRLQLIREAGL